MIRVKEYSIDEHLHRYACWTAARAASISRFSNEEIEIFISKSKLRENLSELKGKNFISHEIYKEWFLHQVEILNQLMDNYRNLKNEKIHRKKSFGIAAKIVSIYIKSVEVLPSNGSSAISRVAFPPVDSILLKKLISENKIDIKSTAWSQMSKDDFMEVIERLKSIMGDEPFWKLEYFWNVNSKTNVEVPKL